jgi:hypothetical protein
MKKTITEPNHGFKALSRQVLLLLGLGVLLLAAESSHAVVPIPDQVFYGTIAIQNRAVTNNAAGTNVVIEAYRSSDGRLLASYRMGSSTSQGRLFYVLRIPMEDAPVSSLEFAAPEETLTLVVKKLNAVQYASNNVPIASGVASRMDFGASVDTDGNRVPDAWELAYFGSSGNDLGGDQDHDGVSDYAEYVAGTSPTDPNESFRLSSTNGVDHLVQVSFIAKAAQGVGYEGRTRFYALEAATNAVSPSWHTVTNFSRIRGDSQPVVYHALSTDAAGPVFFRSRVWLEGP